jgi:hypothetical protein
MPYSFRLGTEKDLLPCVELLKLEGCFKAPPTVWAAMPSAWSAGLATERLGLLIYEEIGLTGVERLQSFGMTLMVSDDFALHLRSGARAFAANEVYMNLSFSKEHVLTRNEVAKANAGSGLNLMILHNPLRHRSPHDPRLSAIMPTGLAGFQFAHGGYNVKSILWEVYGSFLATSLASGGYSLVDNFSDQAEIQLIEEGRRPFLMGQIRSHGNDQPYQSESLLLNVQTKPLLRLTPTQQRLLKHAFFELDDRELGQALDVSLNSIKQIWQGIFGKARQHLPEVFLEANASDPDSEQDMKRHHSPRRAVLNYVRQHLEELRPYSYHMSSS